MGKGPGDITNERNLNAIREAYSYFFAYLRAVGQEIGMERALGILSRVSRGLGTMGGQAMKQQAGIEEADARVAFGLLGALAEGIGLDFQVVDESPQRVVFRQTARCPFYEAAQLIGVDARAICRSALSQHDDALLKALNPDLSLQVLRFRTSADDYCEQAVVLGEPYRFPE